MRLQPAKAAPAYPVKKSANGRFLVDQNNVPYLIAGDAPQSLMVQFSEADADMYFANRKSHGFNTVWINLLCKNGTGGRKDGSTFDGILPFTRTDDLATPNEKYFARCDRMIKLAEKHGLLVFLDGCETADHLRLMVQNGAVKCRAYGQYLGSRYSSFDNILWMSGNDYQTWKDPKNDAVVTAVALGIKDKDHRHLHTIELNYNVSGSLDDPNWVPILGLNASYTYYPTYAQVLKDYNRPNFLPVVMIEAAYEYEVESSPAVLRRQEYWTNLSGATGQVYGNGYIWPAKEGWKSKLDSPGAVQMAYVTAFFESRRWYDLVPDQKHTTVVAGYGTFDGATNDGNFGVQTSDYVTAARTPDGTLVLAYMPALRPISVDMTKLSGPVTARWFDPSRGVYRAAQGHAGRLGTQFWHDPADRARLIDQGPPLPNTGTRTFTPPGNNADGDGDWVLVLEATAPQPAAPVTK
jgi:hypothetical protein